jgi:hypothetical protein
MNKNALKVPVLRDVAPCFPLWHFFFTQQTDALKTKTIQFSLTFQKRRPMILENCEKRNKKQ